MAAQHLLLLEDVDNLGRSGDIVSVRPGFARNWLLPQKKALITDASARRLQQRLKEERAKKAIVDKQEAENLASRLKGLVLQTSVKVDPEGKLYGSVAALDVALLLKEQGIEIDKRSVLLPHPIKKLGIQTIALRLKEGVPASITLDVKAEGIVEALPEVM